MYEIIQREDHLSFPEACPANRDRLSWKLLIYFSLILTWLGHVPIPESTTGKGDRITVKPVRTFLKLMVGFTSKEASGLCWGEKRGESWTKSEFSRNGGGESGCVVSSQHYSIQVGIVWVWGVEGVIITILRLTELRDKVGSPGSEMKQDKWVQAEDQCWRAWGISM